MDIFQFMTNSPILSFFLGLVIIQALATVLFRLPNRILRHRNINKHGYPPPHCDADGDFKKEDR